MFSQKMRLGLMFFNALFERHASRYVKVNDVCFFLKLQQSYGGFRSVTDHDNSKLTDLILTSEVCMSSQYCLFSPLWAKAEIYRK
jgi:hypothetical protein